MPLTMQFFTALLITTSLACLVGCSPGETATKDAIRSRLKDPDSAQFQDFRTAQGGKIGCIRVNAKNSYGGYSGYSLLAVEDLNTSRPKEIDDATISVYDLCSSGPESDKAYAKFQCLKLLGRISLWKGSLGKAEKTDTEKQQYATWLEQDSSESKKWCTTSPAPTPSPSVK